MIREGNTCASGGILLIHPLIKIVRNFRVSDFFFGAEDLLLFCKTKRAAKFSDNSIGFITVWTRNVSELNYSF